MRRAIRLYRLLEAQGSASRAVLHRLYRARHRDDSCLLRDIGIALRAYRHLFLEDAMSGGRWPRWKTHREPPPS